MTSNSQELQQLLLSLQKKHKQLDANLDQLMQYKYIDQLQIQSLKRQKLRLKDQITQIESLLIPDLPA